MGVVEGAMVPPWDTAVEATLHSKGLWDYYKEHGEAPWPRGLRVR